MAYNTPPTKNTGDTFTAAEFNTYVRDNMAAGVPDIFQAAGDLAVGSGANAAARLALGAVGQVLRSNGANAEWGSIFKNLAILTFNATPSISVTNVTWSSGTQISFSGLGSIISDGWTFWTSGSGVALRENSAYLFGLGAYHGSGTSFQTAMETFFGGDSAGDFSSYVISTRTHAYPNLGCITSGPLSGPHVWGYYKPLSNQSKHLYVKGAGLGSSETINGVSGKVYILEFALP